jgi:uncharacterized protein
MTANPCRNFQRRVSSWRPKRTRIGKGWSQRTRSLSHDELPETQPPPQTGATVARSRGFVAIALACELSLLPVAFGLAWLLGLPLFAGFLVRASDLLWGIVASLPLLALFGWMLKASWPQLRKIREFMEARVRPLFSSWSLWELAMLSAAAGVCEEALFRGALQGGLSRWMNPTVALLIASVAFGLCHFVTRTYAVIAGGLGVYLGVLWLVTGTLVAPMITHAVYDFIALVWFLRLTRPRLDHRLLGLRS